MNRLQVDTAPAHHTDNRLTEVIKYPFYFAQITFRKLKTNRCLSSTTIVKSYDSDRQVGTYVTNKIKLLLVFLLRRRPHFYFSEFE